MWICPTFRRAPALAGPLPVSASLGAVGSVAVPPTVGRGPNPRDAAMARRLLAEIDAS